MPRLRKKAFFVINSLVGGGAERVFSTLLNQMHAEGTPFDIELVLLDRLPAVYTVPQGLKCHQLDSREGFLTSLRQLSVLVRREKPHAIFSFLNRSNCVSIIAGKMIGIPVVISERVHTTSHFGIGPSAALNRLAVRLLYPRAARVVAVAHGVADDLADNYGVAREKILVVYNPVRHGEILAQGLKDPEIALPEIYWVAVGRLVPNKNFQMLLQAFAQANPTGDLVILGDGPERAALLALAQELGMADRLHLPGFVANPFAVLGRARAYLTSSNAEGFPNALVEALVLGRPVIATDCDSGPGEILRGNSERKVTAATRVAHGILVPMNNIGAMADGIGLLEQAAYRAQLSEAASRRALDFDHNVAIGCYRTILSGRDVLDVQ